jgi:ethanolamine utilization protein EutP (predicted NTPase)
MNIKIGDIVRFLNQVGGGRIVRIDATNKMVYVEDADGFEIPVHEKECVLVGTVNESTNIPLKDFSPKASSVQVSKEIQVAPLKPISQTVIETPEGDLLKVLLSFFPLDIKQLQTTSYDCHLVNDSNYFLYYNIIISPDNAWKSIANGLIEPNTQEAIAIITKDDLNDWEQLKVQLLPFKQNKTYQPQKLIDISLKINAVKFYKLHSFTDNEYFDEPAMIIDLVAEKEKEMLINVSASDIKEAMLHKTTVAKPVVAKKTSMHNDGNLVIDLHIHELLDSTVGLSNAAMLQCQMDKFHEVIAENRNKKGQKIVFIHGKGEGVLRKEIERQLKTRYKSYYFQDASFREYGFGATMVTIK